MSAIMLFSCAGIGNSPPTYKNDLCNIFLEKKEWYKSTRTASIKWGIPIPVIMAIMYQESSFVADAKPERTTCLFIFPGPRPTSAYGYPQALNETWDNYIKNTQSYGADRDDFHDACDFIGWYCDLSYKKCGIKKYDAYHLYLAYHEGHKGFLAKTYRNKSWLIKVAQKVKQRSVLYESQLNQCEHMFIKKRSCCLWPF
ncbi:MAG: transglycosylase SLT domain-containing protein [Desulfobacterales bacterium]|nr:transglycosylase SLT domain-containing protein [Desulfobacterales bacterium]